MALGTSSVNNSNHSPHLKSIVLAQDIVLTEAKVTCDERKGSVGIRVTYILLYLRMARVVDEISYNVSSHPLILPHH